MSDHPGGYNPMRWDCKKQGCFNVNCRARIEMFAKCFGKTNKISMGDIDATVEINGHFLFLEMKNVSKPDLKLGQQIYYERFTALSPNILAMVVTYENDENGNTLFYRYRLIADGKWRDWVDTDNEDLMKKVELWADRARRLPRTGLRAASSRAVEHPRQALAK